MLSTSRRVSRLAAGLAAAGIATATLLAPTAAEAGVPPGTCTTQKAAYRAAADTYRQAKTALNDAVVARKTAIDAYKADPSTATREARADAIATVTRLKGEVAAAKPAVDATYAAQVACVKPPAPPSISISSIFTDSDGSNVYGRVQATGLKSSTTYYLVPRETCAVLGPGCVADVQTTSSNGTFDRTLLLDACYFVPSHSRNIDFYETVNGTTAATPTVTVALDVTSVCGP